MRAPRRKIGLPKKVVNTLKATSSVVEDQPKWTTRIEIEQITAADLSHGDHVVMDRALYFVGGPITYDHQLWDAAFMFRDGRRQSPQYFKNTFPLERIKVWFDQEVVNTSSVPVEQEMDEEGNSVPNLTEMTRRELFDYQRSVAGGRNRSEAVRCREEWDRRDNSTATAVSNVQEMEDAALYDLLNGPNTDISFGEQYLRELNAEQLRQIILCPRVLDASRLYARRIYNTRNYLPRLPPSRTYRR